MKNFILLTLLMIISSISFSQTINGRLLEMETNANSFDSTLFVTLQIKLNENENAVLGHANNLKFDYCSSALQFVEGTYVNFNEADGYQTSTITCPCGSNTIENIEILLDTGTGREVTDEYINFIVFEFKIIDFSQLACVCPQDSAQLFYFHSPYTTVNGPDCEWTIGEWLCYEEYVPVELTSFTATSKPGNVILNWATATELNNSGFEVHRSINDEDFEIIAFIPGFGTTTEPKNYSYTDENVSGFLKYRLKQIDFNGSYEYSEVIEVKSLINLSFELFQNFPNPFNPITKIAYTLPSESNVILTIYNSIGETVEVIVNELQNEGKYEAVWNAESIPSGVYFYQLRAIDHSTGSGQDFVEINKMILMK